MRCALHTCAACLFALIVTSSHLSAAHASQQQLKPNDVVGLTLPGVAGGALVRVRVDAEGRVRAPYVGLVHVNGLNTAEATERLREAYRDQNLIAKPEPSIELIASADDDSPRAGPAAKGELFVVQVLESVESGTRSTYEVRVDEQGRLRLPLIGDIDALGKTEFDIAAEAERLYREKKSINGPIVSVIRTKPSDEPTPPATALARRE